MSYGKDHDPGDRAMSPHYHPQLKSKGKIIIESSRHLKPSFDKIMVTYGALSAIKKKKKITFSNGNIMLCRDSKISKAISVNKIKMYQ